MRRSRPTLLLAALIAFLSPGDGTARQEAPVSTTARLMVITVDDLPYVGGSNDVRAAEQVTWRMTTALRAHRVPAAGFVTGSRVFVTGQIDAREAMLRDWVRAGATLENHSFSHESFHEVPLARYLDDLVRGDLVPSRVMASFGARPHFYRHPFNHAGRSDEDRERLEAFLADRGYRLTPFTVEHADYVFNRLYVDALGVGDTAMAARVGDAYLHQLDVALDFAEEISEATFGRDVPQILLIHANDINGAYLDQMLTRIENRGYRFASLDEALVDRAYETPDQYRGPAGISWLHRWRVGLGLPERWREEPDPPTWVLDAYRRVTGGR